jgi:hypothetical protein
VEALATELGEASPTIPPPREVELWGLRAVCTMTTSPWIIRSLSDICVQPLQLTLEDASSTRGFDEEGPRPAEALVDNEPEGWNPWAAGTVATPKTKARVIDKAKVRTKRASVESPLFR